MIIVQFIDEEESIRNNEIASCVFLHFMEEKEIEKQIEMSEREDKKVKLSKSKLSESKKKKINLNNSKLSESKTKNEERIDKNKPVLEDRIGKIELNLGEILEKLKKL